jgi:hypothetical protein
VSSWRRPTDQAFTVVVCSACAGGLGESVLQHLGEGIRRCPDGMLVSAPCLLGTLTCAARPDGQGAMVLVQACSKDRVPQGIPRWVGPVRNRADADLVRAWIERGDWIVETLPRRLQSRLNSPQSASSLN